MARKPTPKPAAKPETPASEAQTNTPESTLGDGDATGAGAEAISASTAPEAPAPDPAPAAAVDEKRGPKGRTVRVTGPAKGRYRTTAPDGRPRKFGPEPIDIPADELSEAEFNQLEADPELKVEIIEDEA